MAFWLAFAAAAPPVAVHTLQMTGSRDRPTLATVPGSRQHAGEALLVGD